MGLGSGSCCVVVDATALTEANESLIESVLAEDNKALLLPVLAVHDVFDNAAAVKLAKKVDPDGRRIIGVVTKIDQVRGLSRYRRAEGIGQMCLASDVVADGLGW